MDNYQCQHCTSKCLRPDRYYECYRCNRRFHRTHHYTWFGDPDPAEFCCHRCIIEYLVQWMQQLEVSFLPTADTPHPAEPEAPLSPPPTAAAAEDEEKEEEEATASPSPPPSRRRRATPRRGLHGRTWDFAATSPATRKPISLSKSMKH